MFIENGSCAGIQGNFLCSDTGNFIADIMRMAMQTDVAILNSGTLRSDRMHSAGNFTLKVCSAACS